MLFDRVVKLTVSEKNSRAATSYEGLHVKFDIKKNLEIEPNTAEIEIFNLSSLSRANLEKSEMVVRLDAGYKGSVKRIFTGRIIRGGVLHEKKDADWITKIKAKEGGIELDDVKLNKSFVAGSTASQVFDYIIGELGLVRGVIKGIPSFKYNHGVSLSGYAKKWLRDLGDKFGLSVYIENDEVTIVPKSEAIGSSQVVEVVSDTKLYSNTTGTGLNVSSLIKAPEIKDDVIVVRTFLNGEIKLSKQVKVTSSNVNGVYKVVKLAHKGTNYDNDFYTEFEVKRR